MQKFKHNIVTKRQNSNDSFFFKNKFVEIKTIIGNST